MPDVLKTVLIVFCTLIVVLSVIFGLVVWYWCRLQSRRKKTQRNNQDVPMSDITSNDVDNDQSASQTPASHISVPENYNELVLDHVFRMHQELPPLEPSAPPLPPS